MYFRRLASLALIGGALVACGDSATAPVADQSASPDVSRGVRAGETLVRVAITNPTSTSVTLNVGETLQMSSMMYYSRGGTLPGIPYALWGSEDNCVATVTSKSPSWGLVRAVKAGKVRIIADAWGKSDTVTVTVVGSGNLDSSCEERQAASSRNDESNGTPSTRYGVKAGEKLTNLVLFAPRAPVKVGQTTRLVAEMWYSRGGKLLANPYVWFNSTGPAVASVAKGGYVTGHAPGTAKVIVHLGNMADTVAVTVVK